MGVIVTFFFDLTSFGSHALNAASEGATAELFTHTHTHTHTHKHTHTRAHKHTHTHTHTHASTHTHTNTHTHSLTGPSVCLPPTLANANIASLTR